MGVMHGTRRSDDKLIVDEVCFMPTDPVSLRPVMGVMHGLMPQHDYLFVGLRDTGDIHVQLPFISQAGLHKPVNGDFVSEQQKSIAYTHTERQ